MGHFLFCLVLTVLGCAPATRSPAQPSEGDDTLVVALSEAPHQDRTRPPQTEADLVLASLLGPVPADPCGDDGAPEPGAWRLAAWNGGTEVVLEPDSAEASLQRVVLRVIPRFQDQLIELDATGVDLLLDVRQDKGPDFAKANSGETVHWLSRQFLGALDLRELDPALARAVATCVDRQALIDEVFTSADGVARGIPALAGTQGEACGAPPVAPEAACQLPPGSQALFLARPEPPMLAAAATALARQLEARGLELVLVLEEGPARRPALRLSEWPAGALPPTEDLLPLYWRDSLLVVDDRFADPELLPHAPLARVHRWSPAPGQQRYRR